MSKEATARNAISTERAMKLALEALEISPMSRKNKDAIDTLREALAEQPAQQALDKKAENARALGLDYEPAQQEPVAQWQKRHPHHWEGKWENTNEHDAKWWRDNSQGWEIRPLYTSPPAQRKPLTDMQVDGEWILVRDLDTNDVEKSRLFARAIEAAHGIYAPAELKENT